ncbi:hypothetical protein [Rossellomorea sp. DA94]|nr:hypothetical protein [Rossellomorea sp. DA94]WGG44167.1 hypothetical protein P8596_15425 [Rossellomorea sp. DA94]
MKSSKDTEVIELRQQVNDLKDEVNFLKGWVIQLDELINRK